MLSLIVVSSRGRDGYHAAVLDEEPAAIDRALCAWESPRPHGLSEALDRVRQRLHAIWPRLPLPLESFVPRLQDCAVEPEDDAIAAIDRLHVEDLYLALACQRGSSEALARFDREYIAPVDVAVRHVDSSAAFVDEVRQALRTKLLVPPGGGKLSHYTGRGELRAWLRVVAVREAIDLRRAPNRATDDDVWAELEASATGPELGLAKQEYRREFAAAFTEALTALEPEQRNLLRLHYIHGLNVDELGAMLHVHRSSAARRVAKARRDVLAHTRRRLALTLSLGHGEIDQLMDAIASRLDLTLERVLG
jgi:RNA polymerase sigma-70 factor, ECF subfamily